MVQNRVFAFILEIRRTFQFTPAPPLRKDPDRHRGIDFGGSVALFVAAPAALRGAPSQQSRYPRRGTSKSSRCREQGLTGGSLSSWPT